MEIRWARQASKDIERIFARIHQDNPVAALGVVTAIYEGCTSLKEFPYRGRISRMNGRRELVFQSLPYIAVYRVKEHAIEIIRIYHTAQDWP